MEYFIYGGLAIFLLGVMYFLLFKGKEKKVRSITFDQGQLFDLYSALGGHQNYQSIEVEHQRLKMKIIDSKKLDPNQFKALGIPAFLTGNILKLLIKSDIEQVKNYLETMKKEGM